MFYVEKNRGGSKRGDDVNSPQSLTLEKKKVVIRGTKLFRYTQRFFMKTIVNLFARSLDLNLFANEFLFIKDAIITCVVKTYQFRYSALLFHIPLLVVPAR